MIIFTAIIALVIILIHGYIGYVIYKSNKSILCVSLSAFFVISYVVVGCILYKNAAVFPMAFMLIATFIFAGVFAKSKPRIERVINPNYDINLDYHDDKFSYKTVYDSMPIYVGLVFISAVVIPVTFLFFHNSSLGNNGVDGKRVALLQRSCELMIKDSFRNAGAISIHTVIGSSYYKAPANGNEVINLDFDIKDIYGNKEKYKARCLYPTDEKPEVSFIKLSK